MEFPVFGSYFGFSYFPLSAESLSMFNLFLHLADFPVNLHVLQKVIVLKNMFKPGMFPAPGTYHAIYKVL